MSIFPSSRSAEHFFSTQPEAPCCQELWDALQMVAIALDACEQRERLRSTLLDIVEHGATMSRLADLAALLQNFNPAGPNLSVWDKERAQQLRGR